jgi:hypothetical protein
MSQAPVFFLPGLEQSEDQEAAFADFAEQCGRPVPPLGQRVYSITYTHDGEQWTATVGESLKGIGHKTARSRGIKKEHTIKLHDRAVVVAIFAGGPYVVATDGGLISGGRSHWSNPFYVGNPSAVVHFSL